MQATAQEPKVFLWINKNVQSRSLSNSKKDTGGRKAIDLHIQAWRSEDRRSRRKASPETLKESTRCTCRPAGSSSQQRSECTCHREEAARPFQAEVSKYTSKYRPRGTSSDPFGRSKVPIDVEIHRTLTFFSVIWIKTAFTSDVSREGPGWPKAYRSQSAASNLVQQCLSDELHMFSLLAAMTGRMKYVTGHQIQSADRPEHFYAKAIRLLRRYFRQDIRHPQQVIVDIFFLSTVEVYNQNFEGARAHLCIIKYLIDYIGGFDQLDVSVREMCWNSDMFIAVHTVSPPVFDFSVWDPGQLSQAQQSEVRAYLNKSKEGPMGTGFVELSGLFDQGTSRIVEEVVSLAQTAQYFWTCDDVLADRAWICKRSEALMLILLSSRGSARAGQLQGVLQECCRQALVLWLSYISMGLTGIPSLPIDNPKVRKIMPGNPKELRLCLSRTETALGGDWKSHEELLLWILALGTVTSITYEDNIWFSIHFVTQANKLNVYEYNQLLRICLKYFWLDRFEQASGGHLAQLLGSEFDEWTITSGASISDRRCVTIHKQFASYGLTIVEIASTQIGS